MTLYIWIWTFLTLQIASSCRKLINTTAAEQLPKLLRENQVTDVFLDLDETLLMPDTPFIFGLPGTDSFIAHLDPCLRAAMPELAARMEASYCAAALQLVDSSFPEIIAEMRKTMRVMALTSRRAGEVQNLQVIDFLAAAGVQLSGLPSGAGNDTAIGGIIFAQGEEVNKGSIIKDVLRNPGSEMSKAALVDNTLGKLEVALEVDLCLLAIHFTAAYRLEQSDLSRRRWICRELAAIGSECSCGASELWAAGKMASEHAKVFRRFSSFSHEDNVGQKQVELSLSNDLTPALE